MIFGYGLLISLLSLSGTISSITCYSRYILGDNLCAGKATPAINLGLGDESAMIVALPNDSRKLAEFGDFECKFDVNASQITSGLFVVIQKIALRKNDTTNECLDYVQYIRPTSKSTSRRYCGQAMAEIAPQLEISSLIPASNAFIDPSGALSVHIYISGQPLKSPKELELEIVFTSYRDCYRRPTSDDKQCSPKYSSQCIYKKYFIDGYVNCPYYGAVDEVSLAKHEEPEIYIEPKGGFPVTELVVSLIISLLIVSVIGCFVCRRKRVLCWSQRCSAPSSPEQYPESTELRETNVTLPQVSHIAPVQRQESLPPSYNSYLFSDSPDAAAATLADRQRKESLPPAYNSLFPNQ